MTNTLLSTDHLSQGHCVPCEGGVDPLTNAEEDAYRSSLELWNLDRTQVPHKLTRTFTGKSFIEIVSFVNAIATIAEAESHHPNLSIHDYKKLTITLYTHAINGLSMNDFIMAAKIDEVLRPHR